VPDDVRHDPVFKGKEHYHASLATSDRNRARELDEVGLT